MHDVRSDIVVAFNKHVKIQQKELAARGATTNNLLNNLFKAYKEASDKTFVTYILENESKYYDEGTTFTVPQLTSLAIIKYQIMVSNKIWRKPTEGEENIALEAKIEALQRAKAKPKAPQGNTNPRRQGKQDKERDCNKWKNYVKPAWLFVAPIPGEATKKVIDSKKYWYCTNHHAWCHHPTDKCERTNIKANPQANEGATDHKNAGTPTLQLSQSLANFIEAESDDNE